MTNGVDASQQQSNLGMIVGLAVGIPLFVIAVIVIVVVIYKKRMAKAVLADNVELGNESEILDQHRKNVPVMIENVSFDQFNQKDLKY